MEEISDGVIVESSATEENTEATETPDAVKPEESAASTDSEPDKETAVTEGEPAAPQKPDAKARIRQLVEERDRERQRAAYLEGQLAAHKGPEKAPEQTQDADPMPTADKFEVYDDFIDARAAWRARQEYRALEAERERKAKERETQTREEQVETSFKERVQTFREKTADFDEVMQNPNLRISKTMYEAIRESEIGEQVAYHLGKNPQEAARIASLSPIAAIREIGKLEAKLTTPPVETKPTKTISDAPAPPAIVGGSAGGSTKTPDQMTDDEWYANWKKEQAAKAQARRR